MIVFATSDKGGTGRSVTSANVVYRKARQGSDVAYVDFDFGSPTAGAVFGVSRAMRGVPDGGLHSYFHDKVDTPVELDIWETSDRQSLKGRDFSIGRLVLLPGDEGGGEFGLTEDMVRRCVTLLLRLEEEFDVSLVDLSAGRSYAASMVLAATARPEMRGVVTKWLVFHRWTRQHLIAANGLAYGEHGIVKTGVKRGHDEATLLNSIRFIRTAVVDPDSEELGLRAAQIVWLRECHRELNRLATKLRLDNRTLFGSVPLDPVLQWQEQLITDFDTATRRAANWSTVEAFDSIATRLDDEKAWETI